MKFYNEKEKENPSTPLNSICPNPQEGWVKGNVRDFFRILLHFSMTIFRALQPSPSPYHLCASMFLRFIN